MYPPGVILCAKHPVWPGSHPYHKNRVGTGGGNGGKLRTSSLQIQAIGDLILDLLLDSHRSKPKKGYWSFSSHDIERIFGMVNIPMPRAKKAQTNDTQSKPAQPTTSVSWVNVRFTPEQIQEVLHLADNPDEVGKALASLLVRNYQFSVRANLDKSNYSAFITGIPSDDGKVSYAISGFGPTCLAAIASVLTKFYAIEYDPSLLQVSQSGVGIG